MSLILESQAARSLAFTRSVAATLQELEWQVTESAFYSRGAIDVAANRTWTGGPLTARLRLAVFCVATAGRRLLFSAQPPSGEDSLPGFRLGDDDPGRREAIRQLLVRHLEAEAVEEAIRELHVAAYPNGAARTQAAHVPALSARTCASGFREIDDAGRAISGGFTLAVADAFACGDAIRDDLLRFELDVIGDDLEVEAPQDRIELATSTLVQAASSCELIHPVVVTDAPLSILGDAVKPTERPWLRLMRSSLVAAEHRWIDVVNEATFPRYASLMTKHYDAHYKRRTFKGPV
jgi:hypothetical protein